MIGTKTMPWRPDIVPIKAESVSPMATAVNIPVSPPLRRIR